MPTQRRSTSSSHFLVRQASRYARRRVSTSIRLGLAVLPTCFAWCVSSVDPRSYSRLTTATSPRPTAGNNVWSLRRNKACMIASSHKRHDTGQHTGQQHTGQTDNLGAWDHVGRHALGGRDEGLHQAALTAIPRHGSLLCLAHSTEGPVQVASRVACCRQLKIGFEGHEPEAWG